MKSRSPTADEKRHMDRVASLGCICCRLYHGAYTSASIHHIAGKTSPEAHYNTLPLCFLHHQGGEDNEFYTSRHPFKKRFEARYGTEDELKAKVDQLLEDTWEG